MRDGSVARSSMMPRSRAGRDGIGTGFGRCGSRGSGHGSVSGFITSTVDVVLSGGGVSIGTGRYHSNVADSKIKMRLILIFESRGYVGGPTRRRRAWSGKRRGQVAVTLLAP